MTTWNPADFYSVLLTLSNGNLTVTYSGSSSANYSGVRATKSGIHTKSYFGGAITNISGHDMGLGVANLSANIITSSAAFVGSDNNGIGGFPQVGASSLIFLGGSTVAQFPTLQTNGDFVVVAVDTSAQLVWFTVMTAGGTLNTNWNNTAASPATGSGGISVSAITGALYPAASLQNNGDVITLNTTRAVSDATLAGFVPFDFTALAALDDDDDVQGPVMNHAFAVTPSDTQDLPAVSDYLSFFNTDGTHTLQITTVNGEIVSGIVLPSGRWGLRAKRVWSTGTTVTNIVEYWT